MKPKMKPKMTSSQKIIKDKKNVTTEVLAVNNVQPLMINTCSQTTSDGFLLLNEIEQASHLKRVKELEKEVNELRKHLEIEKELQIANEKLRIHASKSLERLSQIHSMSMLGEKQQPQHPLPSSPLSYNEIPLNYEAKPLKAKPPQISHKLENNPTSNTTSPNSVRNPRQLISSANYESVNYTIVADGNADHINESIEIKLAEEDGALNFNNSTDSGRLEICLEPEVNLEVKPEQPISAPSEHHIIKRRKLALAQHEVSPSISGNSNHQQWCEHQENHQEKYQNKQKRRLSKGLLKICKIEKTNDSSHTQATPIQASVPSPNNSISSQSEAPSTSHSYYENEMVPLGPKGTLIPASLYESMSWKSPSIATRTLLMNLFYRHTLATHTLTGKESPAFKGLNKPLKKGLNPDIIADIVHAVSTKCNVSATQVRHAITSKCADENRKWKKRQISKLSNNLTEDKENNINIVN